MIQSGKVGVIKSFEHLIALSIQSLPTAISSNSTKGEDQMYSPAEFMSIRLSVSQYSYSSLYQSGKTNSYD